MHIVAGEASPFQAYTRPSMADKAAKPKSKAERDRVGVLGTLPASRPDRIGRPRRGEAKSAAAKPRAKAAAATAKAAAKPRATVAAKAKAAPKPKAAAKPKPKPKPKAAAKPKAKAVPKAKAAPTTAHKPAAVRPASPPLAPPRRVTDAPPPKPLAPPTGTELVTTTLRAAGELAQIGLTLGGHALKRAVDRIPRP